MFGGVRDRRGNRPVITQTAQSSLFGSWGCTGARCTLRVQARVRVRGPELVLGGLVRWACVGDQFGHVSDTLDKDRRSGEINRILCGTVDGMDGACCFGEALHGRASLTRATRGSCTAVLRLPVVSATCAGTFRGKPLTERMLSLSAHSRGRESAGERDDLPLGNLYFDFRPHRLGPDPGGAVPDARPPIPASEVAE